VVHVDLRVEREQPLPVNVNCICYPAEATAILDGRPWADTVRLAARAVQAFHTECRMPVLAGFGWRVSLDRKNRRSTQVTLYFVLDGPATAAHLDRLEEVVREAHPGFGPGNIERTPVHGVACVVAADGAIAALWGRDLETGEPWLRKLQLVDGRVIPRIVPLSQAEPADVCPELPQAFAVSGPYGEADREAERMRLAFARHFSQRIVEADGVVRHTEAEFLTNVFPPDLVQRLGLDELEVEAEYLAAAREALPGQLGHHDKLGLVGLLFSACYADGSLDAREMRVLREASESLGLSRESVVKYLRRFW
jgi:uncharacterized tellurite resistance protein B-like protein